MRQVHGGEPGHQQGGVDAGGGRLEDQLGFFLFRGLVLEGRRCCPVKLQTCIEVFGKKSNQKIRSLISHLCTCQVSEIVPGGSFVTIDPPNGPCLCFFPLVRL